MGEKTRFVRVKCNKCKNEQIIYGNATCKVRCLSCGVALSEATGGKAKIKTLILEVLN